ncbi:putative RNA polymerase II subunit B1 CTD phosphatase rpap2 [Megalops cyprinoides]|uniref:putative RNA polymerase II subunit B1 CTD phosphatase rpap2 n=1 Tax=Megalops cyprinoides TaxID=118141 RepID=UPI0018655923|nr:putative RNA polymerase II subunit B1 CTD phosphatase rpap2 [Megalops cyprinoides]
MEDGQKRRSRSARGGKKGGKAVKEQTAIETAKRREALKETLRQKLELEQRALRIVERLLEDKVADDFLIDCARFITPANYKDTVEERSIVKLCGYPVCRNKLANVPKQQYKISTKTNKVYDITERKCFCSNFCYKASKYFEVQISKTPLWLREEERPPDIKLMKEGESGSSGEEVKISDRPVSKSEIENPGCEEPVRSRGSSDSGSESSDLEQDFVSSVVSGGRAGPRRRVGFVELRGERERGGDTPQQIKAERDRHEGRDRPQQRNAQAGEDGVRLQESKALRDEDSDRLKQRKPERGEDGDKLREREAQGNEDKGRPQEHNTPGDKDGNRPTAAARDKTPDQRAVEAATDLLSRCSIEGRDTPVVLPLAGKSTGQPSANSTSTPSAPDGGLDVTQVGMSKRGAAGLRSLLGKLGPKAPGSTVQTTLLEVLSHTLREWRTEDTFRFLYGPGYRHREEEEEEVEEELDEDDLEESMERPAIPVQAGGEKERPSAPVPDYETLHKETEMLKLRVQEFYRGRYVLPEEAETGQEEGGDTGSCGGKDAALPLVDSHAQHLIQKRIVVDKLNRSLRDIIGPLKLTMSDISTDLNNLVRTFRFTNSNIIHKGPEWTLIAVVLLSVLSEVSPVLQESLERPCSAEYISTLMRELSLKDQDLQSLVQLFRRQAS